MFIRYVYYVRMFISYVYQLCLLLLYIITNTGGYYLPNGTYFDWWTKNTTLQYNKRRACLEDLDIQAGPYQLTPDSPKQYVSLYNIYFSKTLFFMY